MKYPCLVPKKLCRIPIQIHLESEKITNLGEPESVIDLDLLCNYQESAKTVLTEEKKVVKVTGTALLPGDIVPDVPTLSGGTATVFGVTRKIVLGRKNRNPDGTVNYCTLELE